MKAKFHAELKLSRYVCEHTYIKVFEAHVREGKMSVL